MRAGNIDRGELHSHGVTEPRLFYMHYWAVDIAVTLARSAAPGDGCHQPAVVIIPMQPHGGWL